MVQLRDPTAEGINQSINQSKRGTCISGCMSPALCSLQFVAPSDISYPIQLYTLALVSIPVYQKLVSEFGISEYSRDSQSGQHAPLVCTKHFHTYRCDNTNKLNFTRRSSLYDRLH